MTKKGKGQKRAASTLHLESSTRSRSKDIPNESTHGDEEVEGLETEATKRKGRGLAKGEKGYGMNAEIYGKRIITPQALRSIWPLFRSELQGPFITWAQYPQDELDRLFDLWKNKNFKFDCSEEELKDVFTEHIKTRYGDWMSEIRNSVFRKHKTAAARYANNPSYLKPEIWTPMVDEWLKETWQEKSERNAINREKSTMVHTTG